MFRLMGSPSAPWYRWIMLFGLAFTFSLLGVLPLLAKPVTLRSKDGTVTISGSLLRFNGGTYTVISDLLGRLNLSAANFTCIRGSCPAPGGDTLGLFGSPALGRELMPALIRAHAQALGGRVEKARGNGADEQLIKVFNASGEQLSTIKLMSSGGNAVPIGLAKGKGLIGLMSREISAAEAELLEAAGLDDMRGPEHQHILAADGIILAVSNNNPVTMLSLDKIARIFAGQITQWREVGGKGGKINIYTEGPKSASFMAFQSMVLAPRGLRAAASVQHATQGAAKATAGDADGIGLLLFKDKGELRPVAITNHCGLLYQPDLFSLKTKEYPLSRQLVLYSARIPSGSFAEKFLKFAVSDEAQKVVKTAGYVDRDVGILPKTAQITRLVNVTTSELPVKAAPALNSLARELRNSARLSLTFRFRTGSSQIDGRASQDLRVLADFLRYMRLNDLSNKLLLVGFSDAVGSFAANHALSIARAQSVRNQLLAAVQDENMKNAVFARGYGPLLPVACNDSLTGRQRNRRVEVWLQ